MSSTVFTPLQSGINIKYATTAPGGVALPAGETETSAVIGIRVDGDTTHSPGNYQYAVPVPQGQTLMTPQAINAALASVLPGGLPVANYWASSQQTDTYQGTTYTSKWETPEVPFSVPLPGAAPDAPTISVS
jgi:hypothetical protein